jgi:hypothetical protein
MVDQVPAVPRRQVYGSLFSKELLRIVACDRPPFPSGNVYWQQLIATRCPGLSWQGVKGHFWRVALPRLEMFLSQYDISPDDRRYLEALRIVKFSADRQHHQQGDDKHPYILLSRMFYSNDPW